MAVLANRAKETVSSTGTGTLNLGGAVTGYQSFADAGVSNGNTVAYVIEDGSSWEIGTGTYTTGTPNTLSRTLGESSTGSLISVTTDAIVFITARVEDIQQPPSEGAFVDGDKTKLDGIEAGADVTDTTNVTAAGALMDSELTDLAGVKALDTSALATLTGTQTLTNKTLTSPIINVTNDATGDIYYRTAGGAFARLPVGTDGQVLTLASGLPSWAAASGGSTLGTPQYGAWSSYGQWSDASSMATVLSAGHAAPSDGVITAIEWSSSTGGPNDAQYETMRTRVEYRSVT